MPSFTALVHIVEKNPIDVLGLVVFSCCWLGYEPFLQKISKKSGLITKDLSVVRKAWMKEMTLRGMKLFDSNLMAHAVNSATNFSSANLLLIAAVAGVLFSSHLPLRAVEALGFDVSSPLLFQIKLALVVVCLTRGLLNFIWAMRQMNYCAAAMGSLAGIYGHADRLQVRRGHVQHHGTGHVEFFPGRAGLLFFDGRLGLVVRPDLPRLSAASEPLPPARLAAVAIQGGQGTAPVARTAGGPSLPHPRASDSYAAPAQSDEEKCCSAN